MARPARARDIAGAGARMASAIAPHTYKKAPQTAVLPATQT